MHLLKPAKPHSRDFSHELGVTKARIACIEQEFAV